MIATEHCYDKEFNICLNANCCYILEPQCLEVDVSNLQARHCEEANMTFNPTRHSHNFPVTLYGVRKGMSTQIL